MNFSHMWVLGMTGSVLGMFQFLVIAVYSDVAPNPALSILHLSIAAVPSVHTHGSHLDYWAEMWNLTG